MPKSTLKTAIFHHFQSKTAKNLVFYLKKHTKNSHFSTLSD